MNQIELSEFIKKGFNEWYEKYLKPYGIGDEELYGIKHSDLGDQNSLNAYIKTEADVKVKFGGFLELFIIDNFGGKPDDLTILSEMKVYSSNYDSCDLAVFHVSNKRLILNDCEIKKNARAVIEIKYNNHVHPRAIENEIIKDIKKFRNLANDVSKEVIKIVLIIDESNRMEYEFISDAVSSAQKENVLLLSNNPKF